MSPIDNVGSFKYNPNFEHKFQILSWFYCSQMLFSNFFSITFYLINIGLAWDLVKSIRDPFQNANFRFRLIAILSPVIAIISMLVISLVYNMFNIDVLGQEGATCGDFRFD